MADDELLALVKTYWAHWAWHLGLANWWVHVAMMEPDETRQEPDSSLTVTWHPNQYLRAYVHINPDQSKRVFPLSRSVLHEVCHIKYSNIADYAASVSLPRSAWDEVLETECDETTSIIWRLHEGMGEHEHGGWAE